MSLCVRDIAQDLGYREVTVCRWIREGRLKATKVNNYIGWSSWSIEDADYQNFLEVNPALRMIHNGQKYAKDVRAIREDLCDNLTGCIREMQAQFMKENHGKLYSDGWKAAVLNLEKMIEKERKRKFVSRNLAGTGTRARSTSGLLES